MLPVLQPPSRLPVGFLGLTQSQLWTTRPHPAFKASPGREGGSSLKEWLPPPLSGTPGRRLTDTFLQGQHTVPPPPCVSKHLAPCTLLTQNEPNSSACSLRGGRGHQGSSRKSNQVCAAVLKKQPPELATFMPQSHLPGASGGEKGPCRVAQVKEDSRGRGTSGAQGLVS